MASITRRKRMSENRFSPEKSAPSTSDQSTTELPSRRRKIFPFEGAGAATFTAASDMPKTYRRKEITGEQFCGDPNSAAGAAAPLPTLHRIADGAACIP